MFDIRKKFFIDIVGIRAFSRSSLLHIVSGYMAVFWILPMISFVPQEITGINLGNLYVLLIVPVSMIVLGFAIAREYGFCPMLMVFIIVFVIPSAFVFGFVPSWQYGMFYAVIYIAGNYLTEVHKSIKKERGK